MSADGSHRRVLRFEIPVDDRPHEIAAGRPVLVTMYRGPEERFDRVEVWIETWVPFGWPSRENPEKQLVQVFGTGHRLPDGQIEHMGSCFAADGRLVWHLYEVAS